MKSGAKVGVHYNSNKDIAEQMVKGGKGFALKANLSSWENSADLINSFISMAGKMDAIVLNAGIAIKSPLDKKEGEWISDWEETLSTNLTSSAILSKKSIEHFENNEGGIIISITSRAAFRGDTPDYMAYAVSKAGMGALSKSIARGYGKKGIIAFCIAPGFTRTDMAQDFIDEYGEDYATNDIALSKMTEPGDIAPLVVFLASGLANHSTGATFDMNAGSYVR
jgi:NAD(P)-dependent dehydrogenase (short-subunit alcohol dehydrogenase family)